MSKLIHLFRADIDLIKENIANYMSFQAQELICRRRANNKNIIAVIIFSDPWQTILFPDQIHLKEMAAALTYQTKKGCIATNIDLPSSWEMYLYCNGNFSGYFEWTVPEKYFSENIREEISNYEKKRLSQLGIYFGSDIGGGKKSKRKIGKIESQDPYMELEYRARISDSELIPPPPELDDDLPDKICRTFNTGKKAKLKKILGMSHLTTEHMISEFAMHLGIDNAFLNYQEVLANPDEFYDIEFLCFVNSESSDLGQQKNL